MLIHSASQLLTLAGPPRRGENLGELNIIEDGAVLIRDGLIIETGKTGAMLEKYPREERYNAAGRVVMPGFVDPHTHLIFAGDRAREFGLRLQGHTYMQILAAGGGILSTVNATRAASPAQLAGLMRERGRIMLLHGTTTAEAKTGYGLDIASEMAQLNVLADFNEADCPDIFPTFMPAHAVPPEYKDDAEGYVRLVCEEMLPLAHSAWHAHRGNRPLPFVDVFCEKGAFNLRQTADILKAAARLGFPLKVHADEFENLGGASLAAHLGAVSADHLVKTGDADILALAGSGTVAVALPCTPFGLGEHEYTPARKIITAGGLLALATDLNPGTAWCGNMQFAIALACRYMKLTPAEAITAATINAAAAIGRQHEVGSLEPGKLAHLVILQTADYRQLGYRFGTNLVRTVIKGTKIIENGDLNA